MSKRKSKSKSKKYIYPTTHLMPYIKVRHGANPTSKCLIAVADGTSTGFCISDIADAVQRVEDDAGITIQLNQVKVSSEYNTELRAALKKGVNRLILKREAEPFIADYKALLQLHGPQTRIKKSNISSNSNIVYQSDANTTWDYKKYHFKCPSIQDEKQPDEFSIYLTGPQLPHYRKAILQYPGMFRLIGARMSCMDVTIFIISGAIDICINSTTVRMNPLEEIYIRHELSFSYEALAGGATLSMIFLNNNTPKMTQPAINQKKEQLMVEERDDSDEESE